MNLLQSLPGDLDFMVGCLLRLLDEGVEHNDAPANEKAVERAANPRPAARAHFKQAIPESTRIRQFQVRAMLHEQFDDSRVVCENVDGPRLDLGLHPFMEIFDGKCHRRKLAIVLTIVKSLESANLPEVYTTNYRYDTWNRLMQMRYPGGEVLTWHSGGSTPTSLG